MQLRMILNLLHLRHSWHAVSISVQQQVADCCRIAQVPWAGMLYGQSGFCRDGSVPRRDPHSKAVKLKQWAVAHMNVS